MRMMEVIANELGVKLGEPFVVENGDKLVTGMFEFTEDELVRADSKAPAPGVLGKLVAKKYKVTKQPIAVSKEEKTEQWTPEPNGKYWFIWFPHMIVDKANFSTVADWTRYKMGNCYKTREEARSHKAEWVKEFSHFCGSVTEGLNG